MHQKIKTEVMIELKEKAGIYAEENVINVLKEAFAKVYADGYRDGYKDREDEMPINLREYKTEFVDLGLPSGTLWSEKCILNDNIVSFLPYDEACKYEIPTKEQVQELLSKCVWTTNDRERKITCIGPNGKYIVFYILGYKRATSIHDNCKAYFWIRSENNTSSKDAACLHSTDNKFGLEIKELFSGYTLPLRLVKKK